MILSRANLLTQIVAKDDKGISALDNIHVAEDGSTVGASSRVLIIVSPVNKSIKDDVILDETKCPAITIPSSVVKGVLKNIPVDKHFGGLTEHCDVQKAENRVLFTLKDGKGTQEAYGQLYRHPYINYKGILQRILTDDRKSIKAVLNVKRLKSLLEAIDKMCPDPNDENAVFIEMTEKNDVILRAVNKSTRQRVVAVMTGYSGVEGKWLQETEWEKSLISKKEKRFHGKRKKHR